MPPKGSKHTKKNSFLGSLSANKKNISELELRISEQSRIIHKLECRVTQKKNRIEILKNVAKSEMPVIAISSSVRKRRLKNPTNNCILPKTKQRRCTETFDLCAIIHGGNKENVEPVINGMSDTLTSKCKSDQLASKILGAKTSLVNSIEKQCSKKAQIGYYNSEENLHRSMNVYYSQNVMGKRKYISVRKANKCPDTVNFVPYKKLVDKVNSIDIGDVRSIQPIFTEDLEHDEIGDGMFRNVIQFSLRLAKFYLKVNENRIDKLKTFTEKAKDPKTSTVFLIAIGGDEAPLSGTSFLMSFLNIGKRIASSYENYLVFGANVKENGLVVRRFVAQLVNQLKELEREPFIIEVCGKSIQVEFTVSSLPNDLKMLAFLAGELSNAAYYFSTFANVNQGDSNDISKSFDLVGNSSWKPFSYEKRLDDAQCVQRKKKELSKKSLKTARTHLTTFISKELKSRQEEIPLVGEFIDCATCEPLHLKNNTVKEMFMKVLNAVLYQANISSDIKRYKELYTCTKFILHFHKLCPQ